MKEKSTEIKNEDKTKVKNILLLFSLLIIFINSCAVTPLYVQRRQNYVNEHPELDPTIRNAILQGKIVEGMTGEHLIVSWGRPDYISLIEEGKLEKVGYWTNSKPPVFFWVREGIVKSWHTDPSYRLPRVYSKVIPGSGLSAVTRQIMTDDITEAVNVKFIEKDAGKIVKQGMTRMAERGLNVIVDEQNKRVHFSYQTGEGQSQTTLYRELSPIVPGLPENMVSLTMNTTDLAFLIKNYKRDFIATYKALKEEGTVFESTLKLKWYIRP